jgi:hypothetical protein
MSKFSKRVREKRRRGLHLFALQGSVPKYVQLCAHANLEGARFAAECVYALMRVVCWSRISDGLFHALGEQIRHASMQQNKNAVKFFA